MSEDLKYDFNFTFGDYCNDGHGKYHTVRVKCNFNPEELHDLEEDAEIITELQFQTNGKGFPTILNEYEESYIYKEHLDILKEHGMTFDHLSIIPNDDGSQLVCVQEFPEIFFQFLRISDPNLKWKIQDIKDNDIVFNCRGYGVFGE